MLFYPTCCFFFICIIGYSRSGIYIGSYQDKARVPKKDCADIKNENPNVQSGVYQIDPSGSYPFLVYCNMETLGGGWTVFQRRMNGEINFKKNWADYKHGFGTVSAEHWLGDEFLGNDAIHNLTKKKPQDLLIELREPYHTCTLSAQYTDFFVDNEARNYKLRFGKFTGGSAGDSLTYQNKMEFSTIGKDNDKWKNGNCANVGKGGWWYNDCYESNLNGPYNHSICIGTDGSGISWEEAHGFHYSFPWTEMKIRPADFKYGTQYKNWCAKVSCLVKCFPDWNC